MHLEVSRFYTLYIDENNEVYISSRYGTALYVDGIYVDGNWQPIKSLPSSCRPMTPSDLPVIVLIHGNDLLRKIDVNS